MKKLIISTIGTSLLSNQATKEEVSILYNNSNCNNSECSDAIKELIINLEKKALAQLLDLDSNEKVRRISAELNGIYGFYENSNIDKEDLHYFITTDTLQGIKCGEILQKILIQKGLNAQIYTPKYLTTREKFDFNQGIKNLLKWCDETLNGYKNNNYEIIFNLTGSFKSLQGYMNTIAMFYADRIIYIFESKQAELIEIPRLPIKIDSSIIWENKEKLLLLSQGSVFVKSEFNSFSESLIDEIDGKIILSVWGELIWNKSKPMILSKELIKLPYLKYTDKFNKLFHSTNSVEEKIKLHEVLAKVSTLLSDSKGDISILKKDGGILYENFQNKFDDNTPIGHFRINQGNRVSCTYKNNILYLRKFGRHDFVNDNP